MAVQCAKAEVMGAQKARRGGRNVRTRSTTFPPNGRSAPSSTTPSTRRCTTRSINDPERLLGRAGQAHRLDQALHQGQEHLLRRRQRLDQMVRGRRHSTSPTTASTAISPSAPTRPRSSGRATIPKDRKHITYRGAARRGLPLRQRAESRGVKKGDRVTIYLPMIPEAAYAMLACARIGAIHSVVFGGFSPDSLAGRIEDCQVERRHHRRRGPARRPQGAAQGQCRRGAREGRRRRDT